MVKWSDFRALVVDLGGGRWRGCGWADVGIFPRPLVLLCAVPRQYYRFPEHHAPPQYMPRKSAAQVLGGEVAQQTCEDRMRSIVQQWILWAQCMSASPIPFLRIDFLLAQEGKEGKEGKEVQVWTGEVSELGVAVELQGMNSHESRDLVMDAVITSLLKG